MVHLLNLALRSRLLRGGRRKRVEVALDLARVTGLAALRSGVGVHNSVIEPGTAAWFVLVQLAR